MYLSKVIRKDLLDKRITDCLKGNYIYKMHKPESEKCEVYVEYIIIRENEKNFAGNKNLMIEGLIQIDVFSLDGKKTAETMNIIKDVLKENGYTFDYGTEKYEEDTSLYSEKIRVYKEVFI